MAGQIEEEQRGLDAARGRRRLQRGQLAAQGVESGVEDGVVDCAAQTLLHGDGLFELAAVGHSRSARWNGGQGDDSTITRGRPSE